MKQLDDFKYRAMLKRIFTEIEDSTTVSWQDVISNFDKVEQHLMATDKDHYWVESNGKWYIRSRSNYKAKDFPISPPGSKFDYTRALRVIIDDLIDSDMSWQDMLVYFDKIEKQLKIHNTHEWVKVGEKFFLKKRSLLLDGHGLADLTAAEALEAKRWAEKYTKNEIFEMFTLMARWYQGSPDQRLKAGKQLIAFKPVLAQVMDLDITHTLYRGICVSDKKYPSLVKAQHGQIITLINFGCSSWTYSKSIARQFSEDCPGGANVNLVFELVSKANPILTPPVKAYPWFDKIYSSWQAQHGGNFRPKEFEYVLTDAKLKVKIHTTHKAY